jgi:hypothetical protein
MRGGRQDTIAGIIRKDVEHAYQKGHRPNGQREVEKTCISYFKAKELCAYKCD